MKLFAPVLGRDLRMLLANPRGYGLTIDEAEWEGFRESLYARADERARQRIAEDRQ